MHQSKPRLWRLAEQAAATMAAAKHADGSSEASAHAPSAVDGNRLRNGCLHVMPLKVSSFLTLI